MLIEDLSLEELRLSGEAVPVPDIARLRLYDAYYEAKCVGSVRPRPIRLLVMLALVTIERDKAFKAWVKENGGEAAMGAALDRAGRHFGLPPKRRKPGPEAS